MEQPLQKQKTNLLLLQKKTFLIPPKTFIYLLIVFISSETIWNHLLKYQLLLD
jgi:hypothetical protein